MRFRLANDGKIYLKDKDGNLRGFRFPVDVNEALAALDENGEHRYFLPKESVMSIGAEVMENRAKKELKRKIILEKAINRGVKTTAGKKIDPEYLIDEGAILDKDFVQTLPNDNDNLEGEDDKALDEMGFEDPDEDELEKAVSIKEKEIKKENRGRKKVLDRKEDK